MRTNVKNFTTALYLRFCFVLFFLTFAFWTNEVGLNLKDLIIHVISKQLFHKKTFVPYWITRSNVSHANSCNSNTTQCHLRKPIFNETKYAVKSYLYIHRIILAHTFYIFVLQTQHTIFPNAVIASVTHLLGTVVLHGSTEFLALTLFQL